MARPMFTQEQVFEVADGLAAEGKEVTALGLLSKLGGGSLTTIYKHFFAWRDARRKDAMPASTDSIPESVQAAFATALGKTWAAAVSEAAKEIEAAKEKAAGEVEAANKQFGEAMLALEGLEQEADSDTAKIESLEKRLSEIEAALKTAENDRAALKATSDQLKEHLKTQGAELERANNARETAVKEAAQAKGQIEALKGQNSELMTKLAGKQSKA